MYFVHLKNPTSWDRSDKTPCPQTNTPRSHSCWTHPSQGVSRRLDTSERFCCHMPVPQKCMIVGTSIDLSKSLQLVSQLVSYDAAKSGSLKKRRSRANTEQTLKPRGQVFLHICSHSIKKDTHLYDRSLLLCGAGGRKFQAWLQNGKVLGQ